MSLSTRWNLIKPEIGSAGAWCGIRGFDVVAHGGRVGALATGKPAIPCKPEWKPTAGNRANWLLFVVTDLVTTGQATQVRSSRIGGCEPACEPAQYARQNAYQRCVPGCIPQGNPLQDVRTLAILEKKPFHFAVLRTKEGARSGTPSRKTFSPPLVRIFSVWHSGHFYLCIVLVVAPRNGAPRICGAQALAYWAASLWVNMGRWSIASP